MKRIGILGGTFNPVHNGHMAIAQIAYEKLQLDKVLFVPSNIPPLKSFKNVVKPQHRYNMVKAAIKNKPYFDIVDFEIKKEKISYSIETVKYLRKKYKKETEIFFIIGKDIISDLSNWRYIDELEKLVSFVVFTRPKSKKVRNRIKVRALTMPGLDISSSYIRRRLSLDKSIDFLVPKDVLLYIEKNKLYKR